MLTLYILRWSLELLLIYIEVPVPSHQNTSSWFGNCSQSVVFLFFLHFITTFGSFTTVGQFRTFCSCIWTINNRWTIYNNLVMYNIWTRLTIVWSFTTFGQFSTFALQSTELWIKFTLTKALPMSSDLSCSDLVEDLCKLK